MPMLCALAVGMNPDMQHRKDESNLATRYAILRSRNELSIKVRMLPRVATCRGMLHKFRIIVM